MKDWKCNKHYRSITITKFEDLCIELEKNSDLRESIERFSTKETPIQEKDIVPSYLAEINEAINGITKNFNEKLSIKTEKNKSVRNQILEAYFNPPDANVLNNKKTKKFSTSISKMPKKSSKSHLKKPKKKRHPSKPRKANIKSFHLPKSSSLMRNVTIN